MNPLLSVLRELPEYQSLLSSVEDGKTVAVSGISQIGRSHLIAALSEEAARPVVILCQEEAAARLQSELTAFLGIEPPILPSRDFIFYDASVVSHGWEQKRLRQLSDLAAGKTPLQILPLRAALQRTIPKQTLLAARLSLELGGSIPPEELSKRLVQLGYSRTALVEGVGQFALRGGILDVFSPSDDAPVRVEFFGDEIDAMGYFDLTTQRRTENKDRLTLLPVAETQPGLHPGGISGLLEDLNRLIAKQKRRKTPNLTLLHTLESDVERLQNERAFPACDRYLSLIYKEFATACSYIPDNALVFLCEHGNLLQDDKTLEQEMGLFLDSFLQNGTLCGELCSFSESFPALCRSLHGAVYLDSFLSTSYPEALPPKEIFSFTVKQLPSYGGNLETAAADLAHYQRHGFRTLVLCGSRRRGEILKEALEAQHLSALCCFPLTKLPAPGQILLTDHALPCGLEYPSLQLAILSEGQLVTPAAAKKARPAKKRATNRQKLQSFTDLTPGDLVVHEYHGIGRYVSMEQMKVDGILKDYVKIAYLGTDTLYVPATQLDLISKYIGGGEDSPVKLNKLGGDTWQKAKLRARKAVKELAEGLIRLYAERKRLPGYAFSADSPWQAEFEEHFAYAETDDQLRCIEEIKRDMEAPTPMDRLLCGDVGFGKTEVALRAAMKAILDGKQVAILVPTTVLAQQHYLTAVQRFRSFPVNIDVLSRFRTAAQQRATLRALSEGHVDLIIGTHKLLQKTVHFKDLGLLIVDEEQRFGVSHKERLKELSKGVDVLTLSATPIPRTLNMALSGIRDMSTIEEPPGDRYPVQTFVLEHAVPILDDAIRRELERGGQVYYLHNRIEDIDRVASSLKLRFPDAAVSVGHGRMNEEQLSDVMQRMADGEVQILVCTTIIETGIDIPNVNTLIIEDADRYGLSQLHQLRGRVGRSNRHAFAYLTYRRGKVLTEVAEKRLNAIRDFAEFGSGFKIAMRDLEIRGAGNLLGAEQSGHLLTVGYDLYLKLLEDAVLEEQGVPAAARQECTADLTVQASIPKTFIASGEQRMDLYRRMAAVRSREDGDDLMDEILDRYGEPPEGVRNLIRIALLRADAAECGVSEITQKQDTLLLTLQTLDLSSVSVICSEKSWKGRLFFSAGETPVLKLHLQKGEDSLQAAEQFLKKYKEVTKIDSSLE